MYMNSKVETYSIEHILGVMNRLVHLFCFLFALVLVSPANAQTDSRHKGGKNDGYTKGCVPPRIQSVKPLKNGGCVENGDLFIAVIASGTDITYQWQKQDQTTHLFEPYVPQEKSVVEGMNGPTLHFKATTELDNGYYRCVLTNDCAEEVVSDTFFVDISSKPSIKSGLFDREVCVGETVMSNVVATALGDQEFTYQWYKNGYAIGGAVNSFYSFKAVATKVVTDKYMVKVSNKCGAVWDTSHVTVTPLPQIIEFQDTIWVCRDSFVELSVKVQEGGDYTYELYEMEYPALTERMVWKGITNTYVLKSVRSSSVYRWKITNKCGTVAGNLFHVKVEDPVVISLHPQSDTVCEGTTLVLSCTTVPAVTQPLKYIWYKDGIAVQTSAQNSLRLRNMTVNQAGAYRCEVINSCPGVKTDVAKVGVLRKPQFLIQPELQGYYCLGDSIRISVNLSDEIEVDSVRWFYGGQALTDNGHFAGSGTNALQVYDLVAADAVNSFYLVAYNHCGSVQSKAVRINLHYPARFVRNSSDNVDLILCGGENQTLFVSATGSDTIRYTWTYNGKIVADGYSNRLTVSGENLDASGEYVCQVQNGCGNDKVVSYVKQSLPELSDFQGGGSFCPNEIGVTACLLEPKKNTVYQLFLKNNFGKGTPMGSRINGDTVATEICFHDLRKGQYYVVAYDTNSCERVMNGEVEVVEDSLPIDYSLKVKREICEGEVDGDIALIKSQAGIVYYLCKYNGITWDTLNVPYYGTGQELVMAHLGAGHYKMTAYNPLTGCQRMLSSEIILTERPRPEMYNLFFKNRDSVYCANVVSDVSLQYSQYNSGYIYQLKKEGMNYGTALTGGSLIWNGLPEGEYTLEVSNNWGCKLSTKEKIIKTQAPPDVYALTGDRYTCVYGDENRITLAGTTAGIGYQLRALNKNFSIDTLGNGGACSFVIPKETGWYYVIATDNTPEHCQSFSDTLLTEVSKITAQSRTLSADYGTTLRLSVAVTGYIGTENSLVFDWDNPDKLSDSDLEWEPETTVITESRLYTVVVTDSIGCSDTATVYVRCYGGELKGEIHLGNCVTDAGDTLNVCLGEKLSFCGMPSGGFENRGFSYLWWNQSKQLGTGQRLEYYQPQQDGYLFWKVVNGTEEVIDSVWIKVNSLAYPNDLPVLHKKGVACGDSTMVLSIGENRQEMIYTLRKDGMEFTNCSVVKNDSITWTLSSVIPGYYSVEISDGMCKVVLPDSVRVFPVPVYVDLQGDESYCAGTAARLCTDTAERGVTYRLYDWDTGNSVADGTFQNTKVWFDNIAAGNYYVMAVVGECMKAGGSLTITEKPLPNLSLPVVFEGGDIACSGEKNVVKIEGTEAGKMYILRKKGRTEGLDTLYGTGNDEMFGPLTVAGSYIVYVEDTLSQCNVTLNSLLKIESAPITPTVSGCSYCDVPEALGCQITLGYQLKGVYYQLADETGILEQLTYYDGTKFSEMKAGTYQVIAKDSLTGCKSPVAKVDVKAVPSPKVLSVNAQCFATNTSGTISTKINGEGDTILYVLYKNGSATALRQNGNGQVITFSSLNEEGIYKIWAQNVLGCGVFMKDSVVVYPPLQHAGDSLYVEGIFCSNYTDTVKLSYPVSTRYWKYYITNGFQNSDTLSGNGGILEFSLFNNQLIVPGHYQLYAMNPCGGEQLLIAKGTVKKHEIPATYQIIPDSLVLCEGETVNINLAGSQLGTDYLVYYYNLSGNYIRSYTPVKGTGNSLSVGDFSAAGIYKVYAENGCDVFMDSVVVVNGTEPVINHLLGDEICLQGTTPQEMNLSLSEREKEVNYYLYLDNISVVDSLTSVYRPDSKEFEKQGQIGCYQAIAIHQRSGCRKVMEGIRCMGGITQTFNLLPDEDTVRICNKATHCISLSGSEAGVKYILYRDNDSLQVLSGTGDKLEYTCVNETGNYKIQAKVAACNRWMEGQIRIEVQERLPLALNDVYSYCEGDGGVHISLPTSDPDWEYTLTTPDGHVEVRNGAATYRELVFMDQSNLAGYYYVEVFDPASGCSTVDSTLVIEEALPVAYDIYSSSGHYICVNGSVILTMNGSEKDVEYELYRRESPSVVVTKRGTGGKLNFPGIKTAGTYYIKATRLNGERCQNSFGAWDLFLADSLNIHSLVQIKNVYCYTDETKGIIGLDGSDLGMEYELMQDGNSTGITQMGSGDSLIWRGVEGKACVGTPGEKNKGYNYSIRVRDTLTGCVAYMWGLDTVIETGNIVVWTFQPNEDVEKCEGERVDMNVLTSGCGEKYIWYHADSIVAEGKNNYYNIDSVRLDNAGDYYCYVENSCSNARTVARKLTVKKKVELVEPMDDAVACTIGGTLMLSSGFINANNYYWYKIDAPDHCLSTKDYLFLTNFQESMTGKYVCRAGGSILDCNEVYDTCEVTFGAFPAITGGVVIDTVCVGSPWQTAVVNIDNSQSALWKHNEDTLRFSGFCYTIAAVEPTDAGNYIIEATNQCGTKIEVVGKLYVDQPLSVDTVSPALQIGCLGDKKELYIKVSPSNGLEKFEWKLKGEVMGRGAAYSTPVYTTGGTYTYQVFYSNTCTSGIDFKEISVHVPEKLIFQEPDRNVAICAGEMDNTTLKVDIDPSLMANFRWYFQKLEETTERVDLNCTTDNLTVSLTRPNSGYYYCEVYNECESKTTQTTWVRVDTIPTLLSSLENDTICAHMDYAVVLKADGGSLTYTWHIQKRNDGAIEEIEIPLKNELVLRNITSDYDSCVISCRVWNNCGMIESNSMILRVLGGSGQLVVTPETLVTCDTSLHKVAVKMEGGRTPWSYKYLTPSGEEREVVVSGLVDSLDVSEVGYYRIISFKDAIGCVITDSLPEVEANVYNQALVSMTGGGERCQGDTVSIRIHIEEGRGPWEVTLAQESGGYATEVAEAYPIRMTGRDTVLTFYAEKSDEYYIYQRVKDLGGSCDAVLNAERVKVEMHEVGHVEFRTGWPTHLGRCVSGINLLTTLQPSLNKVPMTKGDFYVNNTLLNGEQWLLNDVAVGCYPIEYRYTDSIGCEVRSDLIRICVDNFPSGRFVSSSVSCGSVASYAEYQMTPADQIDSLTVRMRRYKKWDAEKNPVETSEYATVGFKQSDLKNGLLRLPVTWDNVGMPDSCMVFEVLDIIDRSGCHMRVSSDKEYDMYYRDTVWRHADPEVAIQTKRLGDADWTSGVYEVSMVKGDSVCVKVSLTSGMPVWSLPDVGIEHITGTDTVIWLKEEGTYVFRAKDDYCGRYSLVHPELKVTFRETGYFSGRLWLEGPFDKENAMMSSSIYNKLGLPALSTLTSLPAGVSVIDWIQVELRVGPNVDSVALLGQSATVIAVDSCLLLSDGRLADRTTGDVKVGIRRACDAGTNNRYLVIRHRNHLGIMSKAPVHFIREGETGTLSYIDFTSASNIYTRDGRLQDHMTYISGIGYLMSGGELNTNALISLFDPNRITLQDIHGSAKSGGYDIMHDVNFDGKVDWPGWNVDSGEADWNIVRRNRQKFTEIR